VPKASGVSRNRDRQSRRRSAAGASRAKKAPSKISTELDVWGLALDLIDVVNANPKDSGAPTALKTPA